MTEVSSAPLVRVSINGEARSVPRDITIEGLVEFLGLAPDRVAVEHNREIVRRGQWASVRVTEGDTIEVVQFVGGG